MNKFYPNLLSPLRVRNCIYKNRMGYPRAVPNIVSGALSGDVLESLGLYLGNIARNGAAVVTVNSPTWDNPISRPLQPGERPRFADKSYDLNQPNVQLGMCRVIEAIHNYGSMACMSMMGLDPAGWDVNSMTPEVIEQTADFFAEKAKIYKDLGFDQICIYMSYGNSFLCHALSPIKNQRTDEYGGPSIEGRAGIPLKILSRIREVCGPELIIEVQISGEEGVPGGFTVEDVCAFAKLGEGLIDVLQIRSADALTAHPLGVDSVKEEPDTLKYAAAVKASGAKVVVAPVGGYQDPGLNEKFIAEGKADFIYMARAFICDYDYGKKIAEGRPEDIVPCLRCNSCHTRPNHPDAGCYVNPKMVLGLDHNFAPDTADSVKKVAVIGGGPAGMKAALTACERGHRVTLFEKAPVLGGQLLHADHASFKWPLRDFKNYMAYQVGKSDIELRLNTEATPELIAAEGFDAVILATGAVHKLPPVSGVDTAANVWDPLSVYGRETELGKKVVVIGGAETGMETALYLAMAGHEVFVLTRQGKLAHDAQPAHYWGNYERKWKSLPNFSYVVNASTTKVEDGKVTYVDAEGEHTVECDAIVACGGLNPLNAQAEAFAAATDFFRVVGDARYVKNVRTALKSAYTAASCI